MEEYGREPCPYRIVDDCGGAFAMGCIGGGVFQAIKGFRNAPSGFSRRMVCTRHVCSHSNEQIIQYCIGFVVVGQYFGGENAFTNNCWKFCGLGWYVQHNRLHISAFPKKRRSLELNYQRSGNRRHFGS